MSYFAVYIPPTKEGFEGTTALCGGSIAALNIKLEADNSDSPIDDEDASQYEDPDYPPDSPLWLIFADKCKALEVLRNYKEARLREFPNREQAESYVQFGFESMESLKRYSKAKPVSKPIQLPTVSVGYKLDSPICSSPTSSSSSGSCGSPGTALSQAMSHMRLSVNNYNNATSSSSSSAAAAASSIASNGERPPFRAPSKQELVEFRKQIEAGNYERVKRIVWDNPRFLISSGDTPTSLKEGYRYNAMHICAQCNQAHVAELILKIISDRAFTQLYAGKKSSSDMCATLNEKLLDYYLNMPEKGRSETPLHFAVKNGHVAVVEVLTSYPQCKLLANNEGKEPKDIICLRAPHASPECIKKLESLQLKCEESDRLNLDLSISALAGPMPREQAMHFFKRWKTPPRLGSKIESPFASPGGLRTPNKSLLNRSGCYLNSTGRRVLFTPRVSTPCKKLGTNGNGNTNGNGTGNRHADNVDNNTMEHNNNNNCDEQKRQDLLQLPSTPMRQLQPDLFLKYRGNYSASPMLMWENNSSALDMSMDCSWNMSVSTLNDSFRERHIKNSDIEKGLEVLGRQLARQEQLEWREYWDFLDSYVDIASISGLARLESYLAERSEQAQAALVADRSDMAWNFSQIHHYLDLVAERSSGKSSNAAAAAAGAITQVMTPYTCVEKSLQVFAKRITKTSINNIGNMVSINDTLLSELKRLKSLIVSFKDDARFISVDFSKVHSRIAHLVASYLDHSQEVNRPQRLQLLQMLRKIVQISGERSEHLHCVCGIMLRLLEQAPVVQLPDALKTEELCSGAWEAEQSCLCLWDANLSRKTSRRKRTESWRAQAQELNNSANPTLAAAAAALRISSAASAPAVISKSLGSWRSNNKDNQSDDEDYDDSVDETIFHECRDFADSSDEDVDEDVFATPPGSQSPLPPLSPVEPSYELFIFGKEPTKRDSDVLNAIFHVEVDKQALPLLYAWRTAMESFSATEMDLFPSPKCVLKTHKPLSMSAGGVGSFGFIGQTKSNNNSSASSFGGIAGSPPKAHPKRLFGSPKLNTLTLTSGSSTGAPFAVPTITQSFQTPLNKMRGLYSKYREPPTSVDSNDLDMSD
ncbi:l-1-G0222 [Drosophila busckii]|uniref:L-1-G0222 n=1 Tax=Drosophila busckii TaxID=30019 RepID=A0A0M4EZV7_DROBS|nr:l-1-G0222 [Drosophila busckii]